MTDDLRQSGSHQDPARAKQRVSSMTRSMFDKTGALTQTWDVPNDPTIENPRLSSDAFGNACSRMPHARPAGDRSSPPTEGAGSAVAAADGADSGHPRGLTP